MRKIYCDKCDTLMKGEEKKYTLIWVCFSSDIDICKKCYSDFNKYLKKWLRC